MKLDKKYDENSHTTFVEIEITDEEMERLKFNAHQRKIVGDALTSDKISDNLRGLTVIARVLEGQARKIATQNLLTARLNKDKLVL